MGPREQTGKAELSWFAALAGALLLSGVWSVPGLAATSSLAECDGLSAELADPSLSPDMLTIDVVDHIAANEPASADDAIDASPANPAAPVSVLYLTPRVASILRDVFGSDIDGVETAADADELDVDTDAARAPIAESVENTDVNDAGEITPPVSLIEQSEDIRRFQQQMYRTDI